MSSVMNDEVKITAERLRRAAERIAEGALILKVTADQLRADVDALALRVSAIEDREEE